MRGRKVPEVAVQLGIVTPVSLRRWVRQAEVDRGLTAGPTTEERDQIIRNLAHYIARSLLESGGFRPRLHPRM